METFAKGRESITQFLDKVWKQIAEWFVKNKQLFNKQIDKLKKGSKLQVENTVNQLFIRGEKAAKTKLNLLVFGTRIPRFLKETLAHLKQGHVTITKLNNSFTPPTVVEKYKYIIGRGGKSRFGHPYVARVKAGGIHIYKYLNTTKRRIKSIKETFKLPNGDEVIKAKIEVYVKELAGWKTKKDLSTFFPKNWSDYKIERTIKEAMENIFYKDRNRFRGKAKDGTKIEFYYSKTKKGTNTVYVIK